MLRTWLSKILPLWGTLFVLLVFVPIVGIAHKYTEWIKTGVLPDFREGKVSAIDSVPIWYKRSQLIFLNSLSLFQGDSVALPIVNLFIPDRSIDSLLSDLPSSSKRYQPGKLLYPDGEIRPIKIRIRGDNGRNYLLEKKSWRIKTKKSMLYRGGRKFSFHVPRSAIPVETPSAYRVAQLLGLQVPDFRLVELIVNGKNNGVFLELMHLNEEFLRKVGVMPVEIIKADRDLGDEANSTNRVWQNPSQWKLLARNSRSSNQKDLLKRGLELLNTAEFDSASYEKLKWIFPIEEWGKFAAQDILLNNFHTANHNIRIIADDQSGFIVPIVWDPDPQLDVEHKNLLTLLSRCTLAVICIYKQSSEYRNRELTIIYKSLRDQILTQVAHELERDADKLTKSINRDAYRFDVQPSEYDLSGRTTKNKILSLANQLRAREKLMLSLLEENSLVTWYAEKKRFDIYIRGTNPVDKIYISGPNVQHIYYDTNNNDRIDPEDKKITTYPDVNGMVIDATLLPNLNNSSDRLPTRFSFLANTNLKVRDVYVRNSFTKERYKIEVSRNNHQLASSKNFPINNSIKHNPIIIQDVLEVKRTLVTNKPYVFMPGSTLIIHPHVSVIFRKHVAFLGSTSQPITITSYSNEPFGVVAIHGEDASNSSLKNVHIQNGSQAKVDGTSYLAMFSIHNTSNIHIEQFSSSSNTDADDMLHVVYGNNIYLKNVAFTKAKLDAIDIDLSTVDIDGVSIIEAGNDCIDIMGGSIRIKRALLSGCGDKGISVGEHSKTVINTADIEKTSIGVAAKDGSMVRINNSNFSDNLIHVDSYLKNWRYGRVGSSVTISQTNFSGSVNHFHTDVTSSIDIDNSDVPVGYTTDGNIAFNN